MAIRAASRLFTTCNRQTWLADVKDLGDRLKNLRKEIYHLDGHHLEKQDYLRNQWSEVWQNIHQIENIAHHYRIDDKTRSSALTDLRTTAHEVSNIARKCGFSIGD